MQNIIQKAIEGGWKPEGYDFADKPLSWKVQALDKVKFKERFVCDPSFWQALGKACPFKFIRVGNPVDGYKTDYREALEFHRINLTEGWDKAVEYLNQIIK